MCECVSVRGSEGASVCACVCERESARERGSKPPETRWASRTSPPTFPLRSSTCAHARKEKDTCMSYEEEDTCMSYEEEDTCMSYEEEDTFMSYEEEDTFMSYEEEDTCMS